MKKKKAKLSPYIVLTLFHTSLLVYAFIKVKNKKRLFCLLLSNIGIAYIFEYFVLNLLKSYRYKPNFIKNKQFDNVLGAILSQAIFVPFTAVFITALQLKWKTKVFFGFYFFMIEQLFLKLKIYKHNWWRTGYTAVLIPLYFCISDFWDKALKRGTSSIRIISLFAINITVNSNLMYFLAILGKIRFGVGRHHSWKEHFIYAPLYAIVCSILTTRTLVDNRSMPLFLCFSYVVDYLLFRVGMIKSKLPVIYFSVFHSLILLIGSKMKSMLNEVHE